MPDCEECFGIGRINGADPAECFFCGGTGESKKEKPMAIDLSTIKASKTPKPPRIMLHGSEGIGKSTFFSKMPNPLFIQTEDGLDELEVAKLPQEGPAKSYAMVLEIISELYTQDHGFSAVVIDSADWLETLTWKHVCEQNNVESIEDIGYGKGYVKATDAFRVLLDGLNALRLKKGMVIGLTAHSQIKRYDDPSTESYDRYMLKMHKGTSALLSEWCDIIGFASQRVIVQSEDVGFDKKTKRGVTTGERLMWTQERPAFVAKNRYSLPESLPLEWAALSDCISRSLTTNTTENS